MKKVVLMVAVVATAVLVSCSGKTCSSCKINGVSTGDICDDVYTAEQISGLEAACKTGGGTWSKN